MKADIKLTICHIVNCYWERTIKYKNTDLKIVVAYELCALIPAAKIYPQIVYVFKIVFCCTHIFCYVLSLAVKLNQVSGLQIQISIVTNCCRKNLILSHFWMSQSATVVHVFLWYNLFFLSTQLRGWLFPRQPFTSRIANECFAARNQRPLSTEQKISSLEYTFEGYFLYIYI